MTTYAPVSPAAAPRPAGKGKLVLAALILTPLAAFFWVVFIDLVLGIHVVTRSDVPTEPRAPAVAAALAAVLSLFAWACITRLFRDRTSRAGEIAWRVSRAGKSLAIGIFGGALSIAFGIGLISYGLENPGLIVMMVILGAALALFGLIIAFGSLPKAYRILRTGIDEGDAKAKASVFEPL